MEEFFTHPFSFHANILEGNSFVTKLSPQGTILFSTYAGLGTGSGIAVDSTGIVVTGWRSDSDADTIRLGTGLFAMKLSLTGSQLYYSVLAGSASDNGTAVALDSQHNAWIAGVTSANSIAGSPDALMLKVSPQGAFIDRKTVGGSGKDVGTGVAVDLDDNPWFTGQTCSSDFPASPGFNYLRGSCGIFVVKLVQQSGPATIKFATVFGGSDLDSGEAIAVNAKREAYVTGTTMSPIYISAGAYQANPVGPFAQGFITQFDGFGHFIHSTLLGSTGSTGFNAIALNAAGEVYVGGATSAATFPQNGPVVAHPTAGIIAKLSPDLGTLVYSRQEGIQINGVALRESVPSVTPTQIYSTGIENVGSPYQARMFLTELLDDPEYTRLRNYWISDRYINIESGVPTAGQVSPGWFSAQWEFDLQPPTNGDPVGAKVFLIRNRWKGDQYLNIESGQLQSTTISPGWLSARWILEPINGSNIYRIRNVWQPSRCLNIESGTLTASAVQPGWWSAWWIFERF